MDRKLCVVWVNADPEAALNMAFMYAANGLKKKWWDVVRLVVWGPSAKLLAEDASLQKEIKAVAEAGVTLLACKACADRYGVSARLEELGIEVLYVGQPMTDMLQSDWKVLTV